MNLREIGGALSVWGSGCGQAELACVSPLSGWPIAAGALVLQVYLVKEAGMSVPLRPALIWGSHAAVAVVVLANLRHPWMWVLLAGLLLNLLVMAANGGLMPVSPETLVRAGHAHVLDRVPVGQPMAHAKDVILAPEATRLALLDDRLVIPGRRGSFSLGDVFIALGAILVVLAAAAKVIAPLVLPVPLVLWRPPVAGGTGGSA